MVERDRLHACHRARPGDDAGCGGGDRSPDVDRVVDTPVPGIGTDRGERLIDRSVDWSIESGTPGKR